MKTLLSILITLFTVFGWSEIASDQSGINDDTGVTEVLHLLGEAYPAHHFAKLDPEKVRIGRELVYNGRASMPDGSKSEYISKFYVCTDCHTQVQEDPILSVSDPDTRLDYIVKHDLKFLQATTFYGMVNRESWYNQDYVLKYGDMVEEANKSLAASTQLCARECSSGRYLEEWELEAILQYYWTIEVKMGHLGLTEQEWSTVRSALDGQGDKARAISLLKSKYLMFSPADFVDAPADKKAGYPGLTGNADRGKLIWDYSCKTCHRAYGPSQLILDDSKFTFRKLKRKMAKDSNYSIYQIVRYGTHAEPGHRQYMPHYTAERMSDQQLEDLRAFVLREAK